MKKDKDILWYDRKRWLWFPFSFTKYYVKKGRLYVQKGLFSTNYDEVLLYRIVDISLTRTFSQKFFGTGNVVLTTKADNDKNIVLTNITKSQEVKELLSDLIEEARDKKKVNGKEFFEVNHYENDVDTDLDFDDEN